MKLRPLGRTGLSVSAVGFGCTGFWARSFFSERQALELLERAIDFGINLVDSGPSYGEGTGERRLGKVLSSLGRSRRPIICIKAGTHFDNRGRHYRNFSAAAIRASVCGSLDRLGVTAIDLLCLHGPTVSDLRPELVETMLDLKSMGCIRHLAINTNATEVITAALKTGVFEVFMIEYNILRKFRRQLLLGLSNMGSGIIAITPTGRSLFRKSLRPASIKELWEFARALRFHRDDVLIARDYEFLNYLPGVTAAQAAIAYVLSEQHVSSAIFATTSRDHLALNVAATDIELEPATISRILALPDGRGSGPATPLAFAKAAIAMLR